MHHITRTALSAGSKWAVKHNLGEFRDSERHQFPTVVATLDCMTDLASEGRPPLQVPFLLSSPYRSIIDTLRGRRTKFAACLAGCLILLALPKMSEARERESAPVAAAKQIELDAKARRGLAVIREMHAPQEGIDETERYARQPGPLGLHARDSLEFGYGYNWDDGDSLSRREKHLILIAAFIAMERGHELEAHLKWALDNGVKLDDYEPLLALLTPFIGLPAASNAAGKMHCLMVADVERPEWCPPTKSTKK